jgi:hypothetical protein
MRLEWRSLSDGSITMSMLHNACLINTRLLYTPASSVPLPALVRPTGSRRHCNYCDVLLRFLL